MLTSMEDRLQAALSAHTESPGSLTPLRDICRALFDLKRDTELLPWADMALTLNPRETDFVCMRAHALTLSGKHFEAVATWLHYASLPWSAAFYRVNLGHSLAMSGDFERGIPMLESAWQAALAENHPVTPLAGHLLGEALLKTANAHGFTYWLARNRDNSGNYCPDGIPAWTGETALRGKRVLVTHQLGFGDQLLLFSCISHWLALGATVMVTCDAAIYELMRESLPRCTVVRAERPLARSAPLPEALLPIVRNFAPDLFITLLHLPTLAATHASLPEPYFSPYIRAPLRKRTIAAGWAQSLRLAYPGKLLIGLFWDCAQRHYADLPSIERCWAARRSLPLAALNHLLADPETGSNIQFVSLHHPAVGSLAGTPTGNISQYSPGIEDFADTAACIEQLDGVVAVDSGIANLAAMMGKTTVVLTHASGDWRWGSQGSTTPWMRNVIVLRQALPGDWSTVVDDAIRWLSEYRGIAARGADA
jgi:hypothetical protein